MRAATFPIIAALALLFGSAAAQEVTISAKDITLREIFREVKKQTGYVVFSNGDFLKNTRKINITARNMPLKDFLNTVLKQQSLEYVIQGKTITISEKAPAGNASSHQLAEAFPIRLLVVDPQRSPMPGVSVTVNNGSILGVTNTDGLYALNVSEGDILRLSFVGCHPKAFTISGAMRNNPEVTIMMENAVTALGEVAVVSTGYQTIPKERATGAITAIPGAQLDKPSLNVATRLIGAAAGVAATLDANGNPTFEIRGQTSLYANAQPLLVVDGFAVTGGFNSINPNDVESVTILKDAAAASIWGARAANGVLVVTTKKPLGNNTLRVELNSFVKFTPKLDLDYTNPLASAAQTVDYEKKAFNKWGAIQNNGNVMTDYFKAYSLGLTALNEYNLGKISAQTRDELLNTLAGNDNRDQIRCNMLATPVTQQYNLSISSATTRSSNIFSLRFADNQSPFKNTGNQDYMLNYRNNSNVFKWLDFRFSGMVQYSKQNNSGASLQDILRLSPYEMLLDANGKYANVINSYYWPIIENQVPTGKFPYADWTYNPLVEMNNRDISQKDLNLRFQAGLTFKLLKGLTYDASIQFESLNSEYRNLYNENTFYVRNIVNTTSSWNKTTNKITPNLSKGAILTKQQRLGTGYNFRNQLNFSRRFSKHELDAIAGTEITNSIQQGFNYPTVYGFNEDKLTVGTFPNGVTVKDWMNANYTFNYTNSLSYFTNRYFSMYGNAAYTFDNRYTLSGSVRSDASNLITDDPAYRFSPFWSVGIRWQMGEEQFMKNISWLDQLSWRLTYGYNGNIDNSTSFKPLISLNATPDLYTNESTATITSYGNPTLRWEKVGTTNLGLNYSMFAHRLFGKVDVYRKKGTDLLAQVSIPAINGTSSQKFNNAAMLNQGIEIEVGTSQKIGGVTWYGSLNFSYNQNKITNLYRVSYSAADLSYGGSSAYVEGKNAQTLWAYKYAGMYNVGTTNTPNWQPMIQGADKDTRYAFSEGYPKDNATAYMLDMGTRVAPYTLGFINQFQWHDIDFSFIVTGKFGHVFRHHSFNYPSIKSKALPNARYEEVLNGDPMKILTLPKNEVEGSYDSWSIFYPYLNYLTESANHVRLQEINVGYTIPASIKGISAINIYAQGNNLLVITSNKYREDPENPLGSYRLLPMYTFGCKLKF